MSTVTRIDCVYCTPSAGDLHGIRRPIAGGITSEELAKLIIHIVEQHTKGDHHGGLQADLSRPAVNKIIDAITPKVVDDSPSNGAVSSNAFGTIPTVTE